MYICKKEIKMKNLMNNNSMFNSTRPSFIKNEQGHVAGYCIDRNMGFDIKNIS